MGLRCRQVYSFIPYHDIAKMQIEPYLKRQEKKKIIGQTTTKTENIILVISSFYFLFTSWCCFERDIDIINIRLGPDMASNATKSVSFNNTFFKYIYTNIFFKMFKWQMKYFRWTDYLKPFYQNFIFLFLLKKGQKVHLVSLYKNCDLELYTIYIHECK